MKLNSKGQVTIPAELRHKHGFVEGDEVDVIEDGNTLRIVHAEPGATRGGRAVARVRGILKGGPTTDDLVELLRGD